MQWHMMQATQRVNMQVKISVVLSLWYVFFQTFKMFMNIMYQIFDLQHDPAES